MTATCDDLRDRVDDLALGLVAGPAMDDLLAHLDGCPTCRADVAASLATADALVLAVPPEEPDAAFDARVLDRLRREGFGPTRAVQSRPRPVRGPRARRVRAALAVAAALVVLLAGYTLGSRGADRGAAEAAMRAPSGDVVGRVVLDPASSAVFVALPGWDARDSLGHTYVLRLTLSDGSTRRLGPMALDDTNAWGTTSSVDVNRVTAAAMVDDDGRVYCSATI
jgi:hypothetical protein